MILVITLLKYILNSSWEFQRVSLKYIECNNKITYKYNQVGTNQDIPEEISDTTFHDFSEKEKYRINFNIQTFNDYSMTIQFIGIYPLKS